jgi:hypothetical protein
MLLLLRRDGMAGMCGVCGEMGLPGDEDVEYDDDAATVPGTFCSCLLDELDERCSNMTEDCIDSDNCAVVSFMPANFVYCAAVRWEFASSEALSVLLRLERPLFRSSSLRKSAMLSSSPCTEPELAPTSPSCSVLDARLFDDTLALPLLLLSSSTLLLDTDGKRDFRLLKLDEYLCSGAGLGELDVGMPKAVSFAVVGVRNACWGSVDKDDFLACARSAFPDILPTELLGELERQLPVAGDDDKDPALKGWKLTDGLRWNELGSLRDEGVPRSLWPCEE